jgi:hypothetical protein
MRMTILTAALLLVAGSALTATAAEGIRVELQILDHGQPLAAAKTAIFLSCDKVEGTTGADGRVVLDSACNGRFYWVEINGRRVDTLYQVDRSARTIDISDVSFQITRGGR